jgi:hypothetical protein
MVFKNDKGINLRLCYLHNKSKETFSSHQKIFLEQFPNNDLIDLNTTKKPEFDYDIYLVDLGVVDKNVSALIHDFFEFISNPLIYFFVPKNYKISLIQLAFMVEAKSVITTIQDTNKVIKKIHKDYQLHLEHDKALSLGNSLVNHHSYMIFKDLEPTFASEQLLRDLECETQEDVYNIISNKTDINNLIENEECISRTIKKIDKWVFFVKSIKSENYTFVSFELNEEYEPTNINNTDHVSTRLTFIELLKDKMLEKMVSDKPLTLLSIKIDSISKSIDKIDEENFRKKLAYEINQIIDNKLIFTQYNTDFYVLMFEGISFEDLKNQAKNYHLQILNFLTREKLKHIASLCAVNILDNDLNPVLTTLDEISDKTIDDELIDEDHIVYINDFQENMEPSDIINYLLDTIYINNNDLKLLNIYDGMSINTSSRIIKKTDDVIYVKVEPIQGFVINIDKSTILQSSVLSKSIKATVKYISVKDKYAILHKFRILDYNPNERQHGRVKSSKIVPIVISLIGLRVKGEMIDISATSIALKVKKTKALNNILNKEIGLIFNVDNPKVRGEYIKLQEYAIVLHESPLDEEGYIKLVCIFNENMQNENILIDYIFNRQKAIIQDIKNKVS